MSPLLNSSESSRPARRRLRWMSWLLSLACAIPLALHAQVAPGDAFPSLAEAGLSGGSVPETAGRVVLVDFWASWCAPCRSSFPAFARLNTDYSSRGLVIVAVSIDDKPAAYAAFVKKWQPPFAALLDGEQKLVRSVKVPTMPTSYLLGRDGRVRFVHAGFHGSATEEELRRHIDAVLAEKT
ncbi:MAG: TlpA disulfide reductase family protein [Opitutus sp.]